MTVSAYLHRTKADHKRFHLLCVLTKCLTVGAERVHAVGCDKSVKYEHPGVHSLALPQGVDLLKACQHWDQVSCKVISSDHS